MKDFIPEGKIIEIRERANILEVISDFVSLKKAGKNYLGLCPFHSERTPSFTVNEEKGIFHCFGCGAGGNVFNFLMRANSLSFPEAVKELAKKYGITLPSRELSEAEKARRSLKAQLFEINEIAAEYYHRLLIAQKEGEEGRRYLAQRGISKEVIHDHRLGFAPSSWDSLFYFLQNKGVPLNLAERLGLILPRKEGRNPGEKSGFYDRFRRRVIFPIINVGGTVCGFGGRIIDDVAASGSQASPKYMNSPESPVYSKGQTLYGLNMALGPIREQGSALIVEGYMDLLSLNQEGIRNVVASLGTALTSAQLSLLGRYTREAVLIFDADESGQKATQRSLELFLQEGIAVRVASLPTGFDPDSFVRQEKKEGFEQVLTKALPLIDYLLEQTLRRHPTGTVEGKVRAVRELLPALNRLKDPLEQTLYLERVASRLGLKESQIRAQLGRKQAPAAEAGEKTQGISRGPAYERVLLQLMLLHSQVIPVVEEAMGKDAFSDPRYKKLAREIMRFWETKHKMDVQEFFTQVGDEELKDLTSELLLTEESVIDADRMLRDCLKQVKLSQVRQEIQQVDEEIRHRSQQGKEGLASASGLKELLKRKQRLLLEQKKWIDDAAGRFQPNADS
jgi:DNA primase